MHHEIKSSKNINNINNINNIDKQTHDSHKHVSAICISTCDRHEIEHESNDRLTLF